MPGTVCVFAKPPGQGSKTRLARSLGFEAAKALAVAFLSDTLDLAASVAGARIVLATTDPEADYGGRDVLRVWQGEGDLGARLERVMRAELDRSDWVLAIGADAPGTPPELLEAAVRLVRAGRAALGPAADGGFIVLGLPRCPEGLLTDLPWSRHDTFARTWDRLVSAGLAPGRLDPWFDLDLAEDLDRFRREVGRDRAPSTWAALDQLPSR